MKKLLLIVFLATSMISFSQDVFYYKASVYSYTYQLQNSDEWTESSPWTECNVMVTINLSNKTIYLTNNNKDIFVILDSGKKTELENGYTKITFYCKDRDGSYCNVIFIRDDTGNPYLAIQYSDTKIFYGMQKI